MITSDGNRNPTKPDLGAGSRTGQRRISSACPSPSSVDATVPYITWSNEPTILKRINRMIEEAASNPAPGIGTPEHLSHSLPC
jgi:hypothetical protein